MAGWALRAALAVAMGAAAVRPRDIGGVPLYKLASQPVNDRVNDLLARMTLEEKVAQMLNPVGNTDGPGHFAINVTSILANWGTTGLGTVYTGVGGCPGDLTPWDCQNYLQSQMIATSRLGIPVSIIGETLTAGAGGGTIFPQPVLRGATFNLTLESLVGASIARQARLGGIDRGLSPVLQVDTDARFGRFEEAYSEDPFLTTRFGVAKALAMQGGADGPNEYVPDYSAHVSCEAKHALAYGFGGRDWYRADMSDRLLYDIYAKPWRDYIREAGGRGLMVAHPEVNGLPLHGNRDILTRVLRDWFGGGANGTGASMLIASDWGNVGGIVDHGVAADLSHAGMLAAWSGLDNEMSPPPLGMATLVASAQAGLINMSYIDRAAGNNLREKFATGLFDGAWFINATARAAGLDTPSDRALAYQVAAEGIVLLTNGPAAGSSTPLLPLTGIGSSIKRVALLGPLADCLPGERYPCYAQQGTVGHYVQMGANITTVGAAMAAAAPAQGFTLDFVRGADIDDYNVTGIPAAVAAAAAADLAVVVVGDSIPIGTGTCSEMHDSDTIDLPGSQLDLIAALVSNTTTPVVVVTLNCRPITFGAGPFSRFGPNNELLQRIPAVVVAWRPGEEGGTAVWDVLTGKINPSGRLTQNWIRTSGAVKGPASPYMQPRGSTTNAYLTEPASPLFPFGHGMSYSSFSVSDASLSPSPSSTVFTAGDNITVSGTISSKGPAGALSLLLFYSQQAPTKWVRYNTQLFGFGKFSVPANSAGTPFSITARIRDFDAYEPATGDYEVMTGSYTVSLATDAASRPIASWTVNVNGTYGWTWDFTQ